MVRRNLLRIQRDQFRLHLKNNTMQFNKKHIQLPKGGILEVDVTQKFLDVLKEHFSLTAAEDVTDDHVRMFIWGSFKNAIEKSVLEKSNDLS